MDNVLWYSYSFSSNFSVQYIMLSMLGFFFQKTIDPGPVGVAGLPENRVCMNTARNRLRFIQDHHMRQDFSAWSCRDACLHLKLMSDFLIISQTDLIHLYKLALSHGWLSELFVSCSYAIIWQEVI